VHGHLSPGSSANASKPPAAGSECFDWQEHRQIPPLSVQPHEQLSSLTGMENSGTALNPSRIPIMSKAISRRAILSVSGLPKVVSSSIALSYNLSENRAKFQSRHPEPGDILDRHVGIDTILIPEINASVFQAPERGFQSQRRLSGAFSALLRKYDRKWRPAVYCGRTLQLQSPATMKRFTIFMRHRVRRRGLYFIRISGGAGF